MPSTFRIASYNVENLFERPRAMNLSTWAEGKPILEQHARINELLNQPETVAPWRDPHPPPGAQTGIGGWPMAPC
jgi:hypothetical protein